MGAEESMERISFYDVIASPFGFGAGILGYILLAIVLTGIAARTDERDAWWAWVPFLNIAYMFRLAGMSWLWMLVVVVPCVTSFAWFLVPVLIVVAWWRIAERCKKPGALGFLMLLPIVNVFVGFYLAYSK